MIDNDTKKRRGIVERMKSNPQGFALPTLFGAVAGFMAAGFSGLALGASLFLLARIAESNSDEESSSGGGDE